MQNQERVHCLDLLRAIAALLVCLYHYLYVFPQRADFYTVVDSVAFGKYAVYFFFILSGFVITSSIRNSTCLVFVCKRFKRIYPQYILCLGITLLFSYLLLNQKTIAYDVLVLNLAMLNYFFSFPSVDGVYWSLSYEVAFYGLVTMVYFILYKKIKFKVNVLPLILFVSIFQVLILYVNKIYLDGYIEPVVRMMCLRFIHLFLIGYVLYLYCNKEISIKTFICCVFVCLLLQYMIERSASIFVALSILIVYLATLINVKNEVVIESFKYLGALSYPFYLLHQYIGYDVIQIIGQYLGFYSVIIAFTFVLFLSMMSLRLNSLLVQFRLN